MAESRISIAKPDIIKLFENNQQNVFDLKEMKRILAENRSFWRLAISMSFRDFIKYLLDNTKLEREDFNFSYRPITRYTWEKVSLYELLLTLKPNSYFSHYTAMFFHGLTDQSPKMIYLNAEQEAKPRSKGQLTQEGIDRAFSRPTRLSKNLARYGDHSIRLLNGMFTDNLGVTTLQTAEGETIHVTDIERTLIDITVRPEYAGGVFEVLEAFKRAKEFVSINRLSAQLKRIGYVYPYHQAIGFYLERAGGYSESQVRLLRKLPIKHKFYLLHQIKDSDYSERWRLYFPKGFG